jgi:hypothetical protein
MTSWRRTFSLLTRERPRRARSFSTRRCGRSPPRRRSSRKSSRSPAGSSITPRHCGRRRSAPRALGRGFAAAVPGARAPAARDSGLRGRFRYHAAKSSRRPHRHSRSRGRPAGGPHRPGLFRARHHQGDLRHRRLRAAQYRGRGQTVPAPAVDHHRMATGRRAALRAGGGDLFRRGRRAVASRWFGLG